MNTLQYFMEGFNLAGKNPIEIPDVGRDDLGVWFKDLGFTIGVEIGVEEGKFGEILCKANPDMLVYGIDPWKVYDGYRDHTKHEELQKCKCEAYSRLEGYNYEIVEKFSHDAIYDFSDNSLDFVYIDGNHEFPFVSFDLFEWTKKVRIGGIISGHDYYISNRERRKNHVKPVVDCFTNCYRINPWFILGLKEKITGMKRDKDRSFMWVKLHDL